MSKESLASRIKRLLSANVHAAVSSLENLSPQALMEQYLREFDDVIDQARAEFAVHEAARHQAARAIARLNNENETLTERIGIALDAGDEAAARAGAERQLDLEDQQSKLNVSLQDAIEKAAFAESNLLGLRAKRDEMEQSLRERIAAQAIRGESGGESSPAGGIAASVDRKAERLEQGFNRTMSSVTGLPGLGVGESHADPQQLKRLEELHRERRIAERLAQLKATPPRKTP